MLAEMFDPDFSGFSHNVRQRTVLSKVTVDCATLPRIINGNAISSA
jgi:hypothetical protein